MNTAKAAPVSAVVSAPFKLRNCTPLAAFRKCRTPPFLLPRRVARTVLVKAAERRSVAEQTIEDLDKNYCDDFECTSSPSIEQTVRVLARDTERLRYSPKLFQADVQFENGSRSFKGNAKYNRPTWAGSCLSNCIVTVRRLKMLDKGTSQIDWKVTGNLGSLPVELYVLSTFEHNLLTGKVTSHRETWDTSKCSPPAAAAVTLSKLVWAAQQASKDTSDKMGEVADSLSSTMSMDDNNIYSNPSDPTRFFQQQDNTTNDAIMLAGVVALLYFVYRAWSEIFTL